MLRPILAAAALALAVPAAAMAGPIESHAIGGFEPFAPPPGPLRFEDGSTGTMGDFEGQVVLATLWFTTCPGCQVEMPRLEALAEALAAEGETRIRLLPISIDNAVFRESEAEAMARVRAYYDRKGLDDLPVILDVDAGNAGMLYSPDPVATPTTFIIDPAGRIVSVVRGAKAEWDAPESIAWLKALAES